MAKYTESFETGFGSWFNQQGNTTDWARRTGSTPSGSTGPSGAQSGSYYIYVETSSGSSNSSGNTDEIVFTMQTGVEFSGTISFYYHQYGTDQGTLSLIKGTTGSTTTLWSSTGNQGTSWKFVSLTFEDAITLKFKNVAAGGFRGDVALDNIVVEYFNIDFVENIKIGTSTVNRIYAGTNAIEKVYVGTNLVFDSAYAFEWDFIDEYSSETTGDLETIYGSAQDSGYAEIILQDIFPASRDFAGLSAVVYDSSLDTYYLFECNEV